MREIKFRAWGQFGSMMTKPEMIYHWERNSLIEYVGFDGGESFNVMQYTGLKDKNGKEIYEGDILSMVLHGERHALKVHWDRERQGWLPIVNATDTDWEVIGNIYENPNLLEA